MTSHVYLKHKNCLLNYCPICDGRLAECTVCGLVEGALTSECPGVQCFMEKSDDVYQGKIDYVNGAWVKGTSPHSPAAYAKPRKPKA